MMREVKRRRRQHRLRRRARSSCTPAASSTSPTLIRRGFVDVLLAGNALAVHDIEFALSGTSLGIDLAAGAPVEQGHRNHMRAINTISRAGGIGAAVESGVLKSGIMHECVKHGVDSSSPAASATTARCPRR